MNTKLNPEELKYQLFIKGHKPAATKRQLEKLEKDYRNNSLYDADAFSMQDGLRERIKEVERKFNELKSSFLRYFST